MLLGFSFQLSIAATNICFYLLAISGLVMTLSAIPLKINSAVYTNWRRLIRSPLWIVVTVWVVLLYASVSYSEPNELLSGYAKKYIKYTLLAFLVVVVLAQCREGVDLPKRFFVGFAVGGVVTFVLGVLNKTTGWLSLAVSQGWVAPKYIATGYWVSNELFAHSLFMAVLFAYGLTAWLRSRSISYLLFCVVGLFGVFVVSNQRTGFIAVLVVTVWLAWLLIPTLQKRLWVMLGIASAFTVVLLTDNNVADRLLRAANEWQQCTAILGSTTDTQTLGNNCYSSTGLRLLFIQGSLAQMSDAWFLGHGLGNLQVATLDYDWHNKIYSQGLAHNPHNEYLLQGIQLGIVGVMLLLGIFVTAFWQAMRLNKNRRYLYAGIVFMYAVGCLFNSFLLDAMEGMLFSVLLAFIIAERLMQQESV